MFGNKMNAVEKAIKKSNANALMGLADNSDLNVSLAAIEGLGEVGGLEASNYLVTRLYSEDVKVRVAVAKSLGKIANVHTKAFLSAQMSKETDPEAKEAMREAMVCIKEY
jgi:HEAT repeat protein